jgi:hypothetical protein
MPIQEQNIVFVESQVMDDVPEGGGAATGTVILGGLMNNVFEDISDLDRAYGRLNLRKIFLAIRTLSTDLYGGAKTVITALPTDDALGYTLFSSRDPFDTRAQAANRVEAYLYKGPLWTGYLYENHIVGMRAISIIQRVGSALPPIGKTLCLVQDEGLAGEQEQYVRVTKVETQEVIFNAGSQNPFTRWVVTLSLSDALRYDFIGHTPTSTETSINYTGKTRLRDTSVADATNYYGAERLRTSASVGALTVMAGSIFTKLVPSAQTETPLANQLMAPNVTSTYSAGDRAVEVAQQAHTLARTVTAENRRLNWVETILPIPTPGVLSVSFRAQGNWYELRDDGAGNLTAADPSIGAGTVSYTTGSVTVTLGALPDVDSQIMFAWASPVHYVVRAGATSAVSPTPELVFTTAQSPVVPGSVTVHYTTGGLARTATDSNGVISGTGIASGTINYATGEVRLRMDVLLDFGTSVAIDYTWREGDVLASGGVASLGSNSFTVPGTAPFRNSGSMRLSAASPYGVFLAEAYLVTDGTVRVRAGRAEMTGYYVVWADQPIGTFDTATGVVTLTGAPAGVGHGSIAVGTGIWNSLAYQFITDAGLAGITGVSNIAVEFDTTAYNPNAISGESVSPSTVGVRVDLLNGTDGAVVANSVRFAWAGKTYEDRNGVLYTDIDPGTGSGTAAGTLDYGQGVAAVTLWGAGAAVPSVSACLVRYGEWKAIDASFRANLSPIKPEALSITATALDGTAISASADANGDIVGTLARGAVNYEMGTAWVEFGADNAGTWEPVQVLPETIRYNAVAYSYLPLDATILGIDPVRLPSDGRVPIFRPGDVAMIMHTGETAPATVANGGTVDCGRTRIGWIRVLDANGATVTSGYSLDRATGIVTFADVTGIAMPVTVRHTVGDLRQITDAQITGQLTFARPLSHDYPANESIVASCLIHGDRRARVSAVWDQATWTGTWSDTLTGSEATATLDTIAHPITVTNEGAETERWLLRWTSTTNVELIGERRGLVFSGPFTADIAPINPRTRNPDGTGGVPYLHIPLAANGGGWSAGNVVRINTVGALADIWIARSIQQSDEPLGDGEDGVELYALGNIDRP